MGTKFSWHLSYSWAKIQKKTQPGKLTRPGNRTRARWVRANDVTSRSQPWSVDAWYMVRMIYDVHMITGDECGPNFLTFILRLRENPGKNLNQENDPTGDRTPARWMKGNDITPPPQRRSSTVKLRVVHIRKNIKNLIFSKIVVKISINFCWFIVALFQIQQNNTIGFSRKIS